MGQNLILREEQLEISYPPGRVVITAPREIPDRFVKEAMTRLIYRPIKKLRRPKVEGKKLLERPVTHLPIYLHFI